MPKTPSWKKTSDNAIRIECVCGAIHEVRSDKKGGVEVEHFNVKAPKEKAAKTDWWGNPIKDEEGEDE
jgi:hypothetical protein